MNPNDAQLVRVFTTRAGGTIPDRTLKVTDDFDVVVEGEAGAVLGASGAPYDLLLEAFDITAGNNAGAAFSFAFAEAFNAANGWPDYTKRQTIPAGSLVANHIYRYYVVLVSANDIVSFVESEAFVGIP
jgi:hypothetical protein